MPVGVGPFTLHAAPLHPPAPWTPCRLPAGEGSRTPPGRSLAKTGVDEMAMATLTTRAATAPASVLLNVAFMDFLPDLARLAGSPDSIRKVARVFLRTLSMPATTTSRRVLVLIGFGICQRLGGDIFICAAYTAVRQTRESSSGIPNATCFPLRRSSARPGQR